MAGDDFDKQGGGLSLFMNKIPGMNAIAHIHDVWFNSGTIKDFTPVTNYGSMLPAAAVSYGAAMGQHLRGWQNSPIVWDAISR